MLNDEVEQWLQTLPLNETVNVEGEFFFLNIHPEGAELGVNFLRSYTQEQLEEALRLGFWSALEFDAGFSVAEDEELLLLAQWLPDVNSWADAYVPFENLLNQVQALRETLSTQKPMNSESNWDEQRVRMKLTGGVK
ncbi:MAG: hypothetical protein JWM42_2629 [Burkholderia sp.]|nr:hypothetical protein [Burkholderia sp.]